MNGHGFRHFDDFVDNLSNFQERQAITSKPFIKIERINYGDLQQKIYRTANFLSSIGLKKGDRIMVIAPNSPQWTTLFLGSQLIGVTLVPIDMRSSTDLIKRFIDQTNPKYIFKSKYLLHDFITKIPIVILEDLFDLISDSSQIKSNWPLTGNETAVIVFTSGTTADPKGVLLSQKNILTNVYGVNQALTIQPDWRFLSVLPLSHMYEMTGGCLLPLSSGASIFYLTKVSPLAITRALNEYKITTILAVPQLVILFLQKIRQTADQQGKAKLLESLLKGAKILPFPLRRYLFHSVHKNLGGTLDIVVTGGAPIPRDIAWAWERMGVRMVQGYGLTETSPVLTFNRPSKRRLDSQGQSLDNVRLRISKTDQEIQAYGPSIFSEYLDNPKATSEAFTDDGWFKTGDIGSLRKGWLQIQGRAKFAIVLSSGLKVFPEDIEIVADRLSGSTQFCIVGVKNAGGEQVHAVVISDLDDTKINKIVANVNSQVESFQHISSWIRWPEKEFPRTRLLKIDRKLVQKWANSSETVQDTSMGSNNQEDRDPLIEILRIVLNESHRIIKDTDTLSDLGLDSLRRLAAVSQIEEQLGISIPETSIDQKTTVSGLRKIVSEGTAAEPPIARPNWTYISSIRILGNLLRETLARVIMLIWVNQKTEGKTNIAGLKTPAIFVFNHVDNLDAPVMYKAVPYKLRNRMAVAVAADVMSDHKFLAFFARLLYAGFDFSRQEPFMPSLEYVAKLSDKGWNIILSPEGKISKDGQLQPFKTGIGLLAIELGLPVVILKSSGLYGTSPLHTKWPKKHSRVKVRISEPIYFDKNTSYIDATLHLEDRMRQL